MSCSLPSIAQLGWALLFLLGSWSWAEEADPPVPRGSLPRTGSLSWDALPWALPLPGAKVPALLRSSPPSAKRCGGQFSMSKLGSLFTQGHGKVKAENWGHSGGQRGRKWSVIRKCSQTVMKRVACQVDRGRSEREALCVVGKIGRSVVPVCPRFGRGLTVFSNGYPTKVE